MTSMKRLLSCALMLCATATSVLAEQVAITAHNIQLVLKADRGKAPEYLYFGSKLSQHDLNNLSVSANGRMDIYPAYGVNPANEAALSVRHSDGNLSTELQVSGVDQKADGQATLTTIHLKDPAYNFFVDLCYRAYNDVDMIEAWSVITNREKGTTTLSQFASAMLPVRRGNVYVSHLYGAWANEAQVCEEPLLPGVKVIENRDGVRNSHTAHAEVMLSLDGQARENEGDVIGAALCYSGNYRLRLLTDESEYHYLFAGIDETNSEYHLAKSESFTTPCLALTFSCEGLSGASRNFHRWGRAYRLCHGNQPRPILLNSWEGVYFDINEQGMDQMMGDISAMGGELFVMDDGWFGNKYPRKTDNSSLGDWVVDRTKLPNGIEGLLADAKKHGVKFGIWIEPEMTNTKSELYEQHPDWIIKSPRREPSVGRGGTQLVLDLANPRVQDYVFSIVDGLLTKYPDIYYIKWDANMGIQNHGSQYLSMNNQSHMYIDYHRGFQRICERIRAKYPDVLIQACASGGARANWGVLPWFDEFWVSDNTDALQRVYMQWGTSYFFPAIAMASHISAAPNHQTYRVIPLKYRIDVAMSGRLGMEIQPKNMTEKERQQCRNAIAEYRTIRPVVQLGNLYRLQSPYEKKGMASLMYVDDARQKAVFFWWKTETFVGQHLPVVRMAGLDANKYYKVHELDRQDTEPLFCEGKSYSGAYLMEHGLDLPYQNNVEWNDRMAWASRVLYLEAE